MGDVRLIAAVGKRGQLGLGSHLPWRDPDDLSWFRQQTMNCVVVFGHNTFMTVPQLKSRCVFVWQRGETPEATLSRIRSYHPDKTIWIAGGAKTYAAFLPFVRHSVLTHIDYDGDADTFMPPLWGANGATT